jgi:ribosomal protein S12 methylthiotransferase
MYRKQSTPAELLAMVKHLRERVPGITLRTTLLTGFPGESDSDFEALCKFVKAAKFDRLGCFAYSREEGTRSYDMPNQLDEETKQRRAEVIMEIQTTVSASLLKKKIGSYYRQNRISQKFKPFIAFHIRISLGVKLVCVG